MLNITRKDSLDRCEIILQGELDIGTVDIFHEKFTEAETLKKSIALDLEQLEFIDSTGVGELVKMIRHARENGIPVFFSKLSQGTQEVFDILGLRFILGEEVFPR